MLRKSINRTISRKDRVNEERRRKARMDQNWLIYGPDIQWSNCKPNSTL